MKLLWTFVLGTIALVGCTAVTDLGPTNARQADLSARHGDVFNFGSDCENAVIDFHSNGGKVGFFPSLPAQGGQFYGHVFYAPFDGNGGLVEVWECPGSDNSLNVPVPSGYAPDLFEYARFSEHSIVFDPADLFGEIYSTTWVPKVKYILNVYDDQDNLLVSAAMGPLKKKKFALKFPTPFENGLMVPSDGVLNLEIAHPAQ